MFSLLCANFLKSSHSFILVNSSLIGLQSDISQKFESLANKINSQKQVMAEMEERVQKVNSMQIRIHLIVFHRGQISFYLLKNVCGYLGVELFTLSSRMGTPQPSSTRTFRA